MNLELYFVERTFLFAYFWTYTHWIANKKLKKFSSVYALQKLFLSLRVLFQEKRVGKKTTSLTR